MSNKRININKIRSKSWLFIAIANDLIKRHCHQSLYRQWWAMEGGFSTNTPWDFLELISLGPQLKDNFLLKTIIFSKFC